MWLWSLLLVTLNRILYKLRYECVYVGHFFVTRDIWYGNVTNNIIIEFRNRKNFSSWFLVCRMGSIGTWCYLRFKVYENVVDVYVKFIYLFKILIRSTYDLIHIFKQKILNGSFEPCLKLVFKLLTDSLFAQYNGFLSILLAKSICTLFWIHFNFVDIPL